MMKGKEVDLPSHMAVATSGSMEIIHNESFREDETPSSSKQRRNYKKASITCKLIPVFIATVAICTVGIWFGTARDSGEDQVESSAVVQGTSRDTIDSTITTTTNNVVDEDGGLFNSEELESYIIEDYFIEDELPVVDNADEVIFIDSSPVENEVVPTTPNIEDEQPVVDDEENEIITWNDPIDDELFGSEVVVDGAEVESDMISVDGSGVENEIITWVDSEDNLPVVDGGSEVVIEDELVEEGKVIEDSQPVQQEVVPLPTTIVNTYTTLEQVNHDPTSFTQGLSYNTEGTIIFETTGLYGQSKIRRINAETYQVEKSVNLSWQYFGEGSTYYTDSKGNGRLIMITWKSQTGWIYDAESLERLSEFQYTTTPALGNEGWGITYDSSNQEFIVSDGSQNLYFWDRDTREEKRKVVVTRFDGSEQSDLNELEFIDGLVCCNVWYEDVIICVDPVTGKSVREYGKLL